MDRLSRILAGGAPIGVVAALLLLLPGVSLAQTAANSREADDHEVSSPGTTAAVDAAGRLRQPTHQEREELTRQVEGMMNRSARGAPSASVTPRGAVMVELDESFDSLTLARVADGKTQTRCVESPQEAKAFLEGRIAAPVKSPAQPMEVE
jgi:hypothetical protein